MLRASRLVLLALAVGLAACGGAATTTPAEATLEASQVPASAPAASDSANPIEMAWAMSALSLDPDSTDPFRFDCPANGIAFDVWGTDIYTHDSSICTAGVHAGVITLQDGGTVTIELRPGEDMYAGTERNGITSLDYPDWPASFVVVDN